MIDRMDIDALLVSALYGELTPADEARLTAHLESHPADRTALADLTHTRATIRESRILTFQFEPPQSVSALLLQEAVRRAPKPRGEAVGWFHRFTRSFMMHPAMAAAAMLVLVVGVAGTLYVRHGDPFVEMATPVATTDQSMPSAAQPKSEPETATVATETGRADDSKNREVGGNPGAAAGSAGYRVGLDESADPQKVAVRGELQASEGRAKGGKSAGIANDDQNEGPNEGPNGKDNGNLGNHSGTYEAPPEQLAKQEVASPRPAKPKGLAKEGDLAGIGIELRSPELEPKDLDDEKRKRNEDEKRDQKVDKPSKKASANRSLDLADAEGDRASAAGKLQQAPATGAGGGAATVAPGMIPPQAHVAAPGPAADPAAAPPPSPVAVTAAGASSSPSNVAKFKVSEKTVARSAPQGQAPPPPPPPAAMAAEPPSSQRDNRRFAGKPAMTSVDAKSADNAKLAEDKPADDKALDKALIDWAQKQRDQVLAFVKSNNCRAAANAAIEIYNRAPEYYAANVATDRSIKPCIAYVNDVRERADRSRAMKRANTVETPAQAAPPATRK